MPDPSPDLLLTLVALVMEQWGYSCEIIASNHIEVTQPDSEEPYVLRLENLRRMVAQAPPDQWLAFVTDHLGTAIADLDIRHNDPLDTRDFDVIAPLIRARLYPSGMDPLVNALRRDIAPGLTQMPTIDQITSMLAITPSDAAHWPVDVDELFALADANIRRDGPLEILHERQDGIDLGILYGSDDYASAHARWLDDYPILGPYGALFIVPREGVIYTHPIRGVDVVHAMNYLAPLAVSIFRSRPRQISPELYHWYEGGIRLAAHTELDAKQISITPTDEFLGLLSELAS